MKHRSYPRPRLTWRSITDLPVPSPRPSGMRKCIRLSVAAISVSVLALVVDLVLSGGSALGWLLWTGLGWDVNEPRVHAGKFLIYLALNTISVVVI